MDDILTEIQYYQHQVGGMLISNPNLKKEVQKYFKLKGINIEDYQYIEIKINPYGEEVKMYLLLSFRTGDRYFSLESKANKIKTDTLLASMLQLGKLNSVHGLNALNVAHLLNAYFKDINQKQENRFTLATYGSMMTENTEKWKGGYINQDLIRYVMGFY